MSSQAKLDLYKEHRAEYVTPTEPVFVVVEPANYLAITGHVAPASKHFQASISALYAVAYTLKMKEKFAGHDYKVCHLEGQWWFEDGTKSRMHKAEHWQWKLLIRVPEFITQEQVAEAINSVMMKHKTSFARAVNLETITEGRCVQVLHIGAYRDEPATVEKMRKVAKSHGVGFHGPHHEIYLSDPRRVPEDRIRTILRYPVQ